MADLSPCSGCGVPGSGIRLNGRPYCDRCTDQRLAVATGWPTLPVPPPAEIIIGPDHQRHFVRYRVLRMPGGVVVLAEELGGPVHAGYRLELLCEHGADPSPLLERIRTETHAAIAHPYLKVDDWHGLTSFPTFSCSPGRAADGRHAGGPARDRQRQPARRLATHHFQGSVAVGIGPSQ